MNAIALSFISAGCGSLSNLFFRKSSSVNQSPVIFLLWFYLISFLLTFLFYPNLLHISWNPLIFLIGGCVGLLNVGMMMLTSQALRRGPSALTFAFQNASTIFPNFILFLLFGQAFGFMVTGFQIVGMGMVLYGLYVAATRNKQEYFAISKGWFKYAFGCFLLQVLILTLFQWRCLLFTHCDSHILIPGFFNESDDACFMPGFFSGALVFQALLFLREKMKNPIKFSDVMYGGLAGIANGTSTYFLLLATKWASPIEKGLIFPFFAISVIILCNLWGRKLYNEYIDIKANAICSLGILIASIG